ncbi:MAG: ABC transporter permease [Micromonosporaceae bacterium]
MSRVQRSRSVSGVLAWLGTGAVMLFLYVPIVILVVFSFNAGGSLSFPLQGLSLRWYSEVLSDPVFRAALQNSVVVGLITAASTGVLGTLAAHALTLCPPRWRSLVALLTFAPITLPGLFLGLALLSFFAEVKIPLSLWTVACGHFIFTLPYFVMIARAALDRIDPGYEETAADLGASSFQRFTKVTLPNVWPILLAGAVLAFALSFDEFIITFFIVGPDGTLPMIIWSQMRRTVDPSINAVATLLLLVSVVSTLGVAALVAVRRQAQKVGS